jgi:hypothetical protein
LVGDTFRLDDAGTFHANGYVYVEESNESDEVGAQEGTHEPGHGYVHDYAHEWEDAMHEDVLDDLAEIVQHQHLS